MFQLGLTYSIWLDIQLTTTSTSSNQNLANKPNLLLYFRNSSHFTVFAYSILLVVPTYHTSSSLSTLNYYTISSSITSSDIKGLLHWVFPVTATSMSCVTIFKLVLRKP
jgi:hypothetical protein